MNLSKDGWNDRYWNPVTGCDRKCPYCSLWKKAPNFAGDIRLNMASPQLTHIVDGKVFRLEKPFRQMNGKIAPLPVGFLPTLHNYRLADPARVTKKSVNFLVGQQGDMFCDAVPDELIITVLEAAAAAPWHRYLFLTQNPARYAKLEEHGLLPQNDFMWYGATTTTVTEFENAVNIFGERIPGYRVFLCMMPLHEPLAESKLWDDLNYGWINWIIIGAETGCRKDKVIPCRQWIEAILERCEEIIIPVYMDTSITDSWISTPFLDEWGRDLFQDYPLQLRPRPAPRPRHRVYVEKVRDKKYCSSCGCSVQGKTAYRMGGRKYECIACYTKLEAESWETQRKQ